MSQTHSLGLNVANMTGRSESGSSRRQAAQAKPLHQGVHRTCTERPPVLYTTLHYFPTVSQTPSSRFRSQTPERLVTGVNADARAEPANPWANAWSQANGP